MPEMLFAATFRVVRLVNAARSLMSEILFDERFRLFRLVRLASGALGRITGRVDVEDLLDVIFRDFCIGK